MLVLARLLGGILALCLFAAIPIAQVGDVHDAAAAGDLAKLRALLEKEPALLEDRDERGRTPLHLASANGHLPAVTYLIARGADLNASDHTGSTPLHHAAWADRDEVAGALLQNGATPDARDAERNTPLSTSATRGSVRTAARLLDAGVTVEAADAYGRTPLLLVARESGRVDVARLLLDRKANVNAADKFGDTPLTLAAWRGFGPLVQLLLERGANVALPGEAGASLLRDAAGKGLESLFARVADGGAVLSIQNARGASLLQEAAGGGSVTIIERLLANKLDVNQQDRDGWTPLHNAAYLGRVEAVRTLLARGADPNRRTRLGQTAWNLATEHGLPDVGALLAAVQGADLALPRFPRLSGSYLGQKPPGRIAEEFAVGIVGGHFSVHSAVTFSPDGREAYWSESLPPRGAGYGTGRTMMSRRAGDRWTYPWRASVGSVPLEDVPVVSADGKRIYDMARRPLPGQTAGGKENIWVADRVGGGWGEPRPLEQTVNALPHHWQFSVDRNGSVYFASNWKGAKGLFVSRLVNGRHADPVPLNGTLATSDRDAMPFVAADGSYLLFQRNFDIHVSFRARDGAWLAPVPLPAGVNTKDVEVCPVVSPDGRYLFFMRAGRVFWVDAAVIDDVRPRATTGDL